MKSYTGLLAAIAKYKLYYLFNFPESLPINYTLIPSTKCNSRCQTCNIWKQKHNELSIKEWEKIIKSLGKSPFWITISGGEPFLYPEIVNFCKLLENYSQPKIINIPTNSILWTIIDKKVEQILKVCSSSQVVINFSLDGVGKKHDQIRGVKKNFVFFEKNYQRLFKLKKKYKNLNLGIHSVISEINFKDVEELYEYSFSLNPDQYITEIAEERVELDTIGEKITPSYSKYSKAIDRLLKIISEKNFAGLAKVTEGFRIEYYKMVKKWLREKRQIIPCYAAIASCQISSWGEVWPCCVRGDNLGNLRDYNYDFFKIWFGEKAKEVRESIKNKECSCPLANASYTNMFLDPGTVVKVFLNLIR